VWLDRAEQIAALLDAAGTLERQARADRQGIGRRALLATLTLGDLRVGELCALRWRHVDLAGGRMRVVDSKTDAGVRTVDLLPALYDELLTHKALSAITDPDALVFPTLGGRPRDPNNVRERVLRPVLRQANTDLERRGLAPLPDGVTCHKLRHTFASILVALGEDPRYVMGQLGHADPGFTLRLYTHAMRRDDGERARLRALVNGADWALTGTSDSVPASRG
jgi:integrase